MSFIIFQDWSLRKQVSEPPCKEFWLNVKALNTESSYLNSRVMMLYCHTMMLYHSVVLLYHNVVLLYFLYGDLDISNIKGKEKIEVMKSHTCSIVTHQSFWVPHSQVYLWVSESLWEAVFSNSHIQPWDLSTIEHLVKRNNISYKALW